MTKDYTSNRLQASLALSKRTGSLNLLVVSHISFPVHFLVGYKTHIKCVTFRKSGKRPVLGLILG